MNRLVHGDAAALLIDLPDQHRKLLFTSAGLCAVSDEEIGDSFAERCFATTIPREHIDEIALHGIPDNISKQSLAAANYCLLIRPSLDDEFLVRQRAFAEQKHLTLNQLSLTPASIEFDSSDHPSVTITSAMDIHGKAIQ